MSKSYLGMVPEAQFRGDKVLHVCMEKHDQTLFGEIVCEGQVDGMSSLRAFVFNVLADLIYE